MDSGKMGVVTLVGVVILLMMGVLQVAQKDNMERRLEEMRKDGEASLKETQNLTRDVKELERLQERLKSMEAKLQGIEENAKRLENLTGRVETLTRLGMVVGGGQQRPAEPDGGRKPPVGRDWVVSEEPKTEFDAWKKTLVGRTLTDAEISKLWAAGPDGVVRPVVPPDATWYDPSRSGRQIRRWFSTDPKGFNPLVENSADVSEVQSYCMMGLCTRRLTDPDVWEYDLASSAEISDDYKTYTFKIRRGVLWQVPTVDVTSAQYSWLRDANREVTAADFKFYVDLVLNPQVQCEHLRNYYEDVQSAEVLDKYTLKVTWKKKTFVSLSSTLSITPLPRFIYACDANGQPFPEATLGKEFNEHWYNNFVCGCGPYVFTEWVRGQYVKIRRNPEYVGPPSPIDEVVFLIVKDPESAFLKLQSDNPRDRLDFMDITRTQYKKHYKEPKAENRKPTFHEWKKNEDSDIPVSLYFYRNFGYSYIGWNRQSDLFRDKLVRTALSHAFPRQRVLDTVLEGLGDIITGTFFIESPDYDKSVKSHTFDPDIASGLFAQAGWADDDGNGVLEKEIDGKIQEFRFRLYVFSGNEAARAFCNIYKDELRKINVVMEVVPTDWSLLQQKMENREFDAYYGGWALGWESDPYQLWHSKMADTPKSSNFVSFRNERCDRIIELCRETFDPAERKKLFNEFHRIVYDDQPYLFLYCSKLIPAFWDHVTPEFYRNRPQDISLRWYTE